MQLLTVVRLGSRVRTLRAALASPDLGLETAAVRLRNAVLLAESGTHAIAYCGATRFASTHAPRGACQPRFGSRNCGGKATERCSFGRKWHACNCLLWCDSVREYARSARRLPAPIWVSKLRR